MVHMLELTILKLEQHLKIFQLWATSFS